jgi:hypothetical protein
MDALSFKTLPKKGLQRYFVWLCKINNLLPLWVQLSDKELWCIARLIKRSVK